MASYFRICVVPPEIHISDYNLGSKVVKTISVKNFSESVKQIFLRPPSLPQFTLAKGVPLNGYIDIRIDETDNSISKRKVLFRNAGVADTTVSLKYNQSVLKVIPSIFKIQAGFDTKKVPSDIDSSAVEVQIEFLHNLARTYTEEITVESITDKSLTPPEIHHPITVTGTILNHKLCIYRQIKTNQQKLSTIVLSDPQNLDFGTIYFSQAAQFNSFLENRSLERIRWVVTHAGESAPMIPYSISLTSGFNQFSHQQFGLAKAAPSFSREAAGISGVDDAEAKASMKVYPLEGELAPGASCNLVFTFSPNQHLSVEEAQQSSHSITSTANKQVQLHKTNLKKQRLRHHFANSDSIFSYSVPMQLKILKPNSKEKNIGGGNIGDFTKDSVQGQDETSPSNAGEEPIDILLTGKACLAKPEIDKTEILFESLLLKCNHGILKNCCKNILPHNTHAQQCSCESEVEATLEGAEAATIRGTSTTVVAAGHIETGKEYNENCCIRRRKTQVCLKNSSKFLGIRYEFQQIAQFHAVPCAGKLRPGEAKMITIVFEPNQLGEFDKIMELHIFSADKTPKMDDSNSSSNVNFGNEFISFVGKSANSVRQPIRKIKLKLSGSLKPKKSDFFGEIANVEDRTKKFNPEWEDKIENRNIYLDYLKSSRIRRLVGKRNARIGDDGVQISYETLLTEDSCLDSENGLIPPEPTDYTNQKITDCLRNAFSGQLDDGQKVKNLFQQLSGPVVYNPPDGDYSTYDSYLSADDLSNIFAASSFIDFGNVTVHSVNKLPLNFLNLTPKKTSVHISIQSTYSEISVSPINLLLEPLHVSGFSVGFKNSTAGNFTGKLTYLVNSRYKYQIFVKALVNPVHLELSSKSIEIAIDATDSNIQFPAITTTATTTTATTRHQAEKSIQIHNNGNFPACFNWVVEYAPNFSGNGISAEGNFTIEPSSGVVSSTETIDVKIIYNAGIKSVCEQTLKLDVIDPETEKVCDTLRLKCRGEIPSTACLLLTSVKQGPLDLGVFSLCYPKFDSRSSLNVLASHFVIPIEVAGEKGNRQSGSFKGSRMIKVKNTSQNACFFSAHVVSKNPNVQLSPSTGIIQPNGGITEINIIVMPLDPGVFEDELHICIIGGGRILKVPFKYEGRKPSVSIIAKKLENFSTGTILGTSSMVTLEFTNLEEVTARVVVDFRQLPEFNLNMVNTAAISTQQSSRATTPAGKRARILSSGILSSRLTVLKVFSPTDTIYEFDALDDARFSEIKNKKNFNIFGKTDLCGKLYVFDILPNELVTCSVEYTPVSEKFIQITLPVFVIGMEVVGNLAIKALGIKSPISMTKSSITFKNKVVLKETGIVGVSMLKSAMKDTTTIVNNSDKLIQWFFDTNPLEDDDDVFKIEPFHGCLNPGAKQTVSISFHPESIGVYVSKVPLHIDYMGRHAPFSLEICGTGVDPSVSFDPPEIFLPIAPLGKESVAAFYIINYGCERTEIKYEFFSEMINRYGHLDIQFPEGKLLKNDGERLPVVICFASNPVSPMESPKIAISDNESRHKLGETILDGLIKQEMKAVSSNTSIYDGTCKYLKISGQENDKRISIANREENAEKTIHSIYGAPLSFTAKIEFSESTRSFFLPIHGTFDASLLTLHSHIAGYKNGEFSISEQINGHVVFEIKNNNDKKNDMKRNRGMMIQRPLKSPAGINLEDVDLSVISDALDKTASTLLKWIGGHIDLGTVELSANGKLLLDLIHSISGKKKLIPNLVTANSVAVSDRIGSVHKLYQEILSGLAASGALLSSVKPEFLLSKDDFRAYGQLKMEKMKKENRGASVPDELLEYQKQLEKNFSIISKEAWISVISQIVRIYVVQVITLKHFRSLSGVGSDETQLYWPIVPKGNIYSTSESILLRWASYHTWKY
ncbi:Cilia- and flagella-associated protein 47 [Physocladia obscura]|uniref:Cilia- and flagella-associated protein 47 n=1 Tax=Physocladia obscura TaxID=109957 RepID=A0AAD5XMM6_9FUNG|nr:Cilia- and flagella-associated protein 47 [Physocladia obscura]